MVKIVDHRNEKMLLSNLAVGTVFELGNVVYIKCTLETALCNELPDSPIAVAYAMAMDNMTVYMFGNPEACEVTLISDSEFHLLGR